MEASAHPKSSKAKTRQITLILPVLLAFTLMPLPTYSNPQAPQKLTWQVSSQTGEIIWATSNLVPPGTWWPTLSPDFCQLAAGLDSWDIPGSQPQQLSIDAGKRFSPGGKFGCGSPEARCFLGKLDFYVCPKDGWGQSAARRCGGLESLYCGVWGCETTGDAYWRLSSSWDWITVHKNYASPEQCSSTSAGPCSTSPTCLPLNITITSQGRAGGTSGWIQGRTWGIRWHFPNRMIRKDLGATFTIKLKIESPLGQVLPDQGHPPPEPPKETYNFPRPMSGDPSPPISTALRPNSAYSQDDRKQVPGTLLC